jgi:hypothetical protein
MVLFMQFFQRVGVLLLNGTLAAAAVGEPTLFFF